MKVTTFYNEHDGRLMIQWMEGPFIEVPISDEVVLLVQGNKQGVIIGVEIPQPTVVTNLCKEIAGQAKLFEHCQQLRNNTVKLLDVLRGGENHPCGDDALENAPIEAIDLIETLRSGG